MKDIKAKPSTLMSIFKRKGGEGALTKIITEENKLNFLNQVAFLDVIEVPLLCFKQDELNWLLITSHRILEVKEGVELSIPFYELVGVTLALQEEFKDGIRSKLDFTRLILRDKSDRKYVMKFEEGEPFRGIFQLLSYVSLVRDL